MKNGGDLMKPISRGCGPTEYTLRAACEQGFQFSFDEQSSASSFTIDGVACLAEMNEGRLVLSATGFASVPAASVFFHRLKLRLATASIQNRAAISIPSQVEEAGDAPFVLPEGDSSLKRLDWPKTTIQPKLISSIGAWIYPEHGFVLLSPIFSIKSLFQGSLQTFISAVEGLPQTPVGPQVDALLLVATEAYAQAARSTQWVWSFLLTVMTLEMLTTRGARKQALISLVQKYCAPTIAANPLASMFSDPADCRAKIAAIYDLRSQYTHEGFVPPGKADLPSFQAARETALKVLAHILLERLAGR